VPSRLRLLPSNSVVPVYFGLFPFEDANTPFKIEAHHQHLEKRRNASITDRGWAKPNNAPAYAL
jgi:hypothetical protein